MLLYDIRVFIGDKIITTDTEFWLRIANFLESKQKASAIALALLMFFIAATIGFTEMAKDVLRNIEPPYVTVGLLVFCYTIALLIISAITWVIPRSIGLLNSVIALLVRRCQLLRATYGAHQQAKRQIVNAITALSPQEKAFLELFCSDGVTPQRVAHERLPHQTYAAHRGLIKNGLVIKIEDPECLPVEHFALTIDAIPLLQKLVYGGKKPLTEIKLRLNCVAGPDSSGSPPVGRSPRR